MRIAYVVNSYPKISHSFVRREILALERTGFEITRLAIRGWENPLADEADINEARQTRYILKAGPFGILGAVVFSLLSQPRGFFRALGASLRMMRKHSKTFVHPVIYFVEACVAGQWLRVAEVD